MRSTGLRLLLAAATLAGLGATNAYADDSDWGSLTAYVAVTSDYRYRGISQNNRDVSPQGSLNWSGPDGFYVGTWLSTTNWTAPAPSDPNFEMDIYGGKHTDLGGTDLNVEAYYYSYPDYNNTFGPKAASYYETIVQLSHAFGPLTLTATGANSPEWSLGGGTAWYVEGTAAYTINDWLSLSGNVGHQWAAAAASFGSRDYTHFDVGATATYKSFVLDARFVGTDLSKAQCGAFWMGTKDACEDTFVATLTYNMALLP